MKTVKLLTSGEVCRLAGLEPHVFNDWCVKGIVTPVEGGSKQGDHRRFTIMQAVGIAVGAELRRGDRGCVLSYVAEVVAAFASMGEKELEKAMAKDGTSFVMVHHGKPVLRGPAFDWVNVDDIYRKVTNN